MSKQIKQIQIRAIVVMHGIDTMAISLVESVMGCTGVTLGDNTCWRAGNRPYSWLRIIHLITYKGWVGQDS